MTDNWMPAASLQDTTKVLADAAIKGKIDDMSSIDANVLTGKLIPAGTGLYTFHTFEEKINEKTNIPAK